MFVNIFFIHVLIFLISGDARLYVCDNRREEKVPIEDSILYFLLH